MDKKNVLIQLCPVIENKWDNVLCHLGHFKPAEYQGVPQAVLFGAICVRYYSKAVRE